jgi:hypothetical protein
VISWQDPPLTGAGWEMSVAVAGSGRPARAASTQGPWPIVGCATRSEGLAKAKAFIDSMLA